MAHSIKKPDMVISPHQVRPKSDLKRQPSSQSGADFQRIFQREVQKKQDVRFSAHAAKRLQSRQINLTQQQQQKLNQAVDKAGNKGVQDSLILLNQLAFVVNVKNRMVVTAMDDTQMKENVFTNIDGAMIISDEKE